ncbi:hypothetical protein RESH_04893 [Rhodopirellula europaea SH398]|uniref:Uncharacterized protein n=1 Tax=Rhodopirellula europaea SH398 TaxID=1263868 RepID=M5SA27_9BACT|nr:hypothetical protein RESH_04893 [Rhodopirellula europaea SH398]
MRRLKFDAAAYRWARSRWRGQLGSAITRIHLKTWEIEACLI